MTAKKVAKPVLKRTSLKYLRQSNTKLRKIAKDQYKTGYEAGFAEGLRLRDTPGTPKEVGWPIRSGLAVWWKQLLRDLLRK